MKQRKKQLLATVLAAMMFVSQANIVTLAVGEDTSLTAEEAVSVSTLADLQAAIEAGSTEITLTSAITISSAVTLSSTNAVTINTDAVDAFTVISGGNLTLGDNITVKSSTSIIYANGGTVNISGAELVSTTSRYGYVTCYADNNGTINVTKGSISTGEVEAIEVCGASANISGGTVSASDCSAIKVSESGKVTVSGTGKVTAAGQSYVTIYTAGNNATITVEGGTVVSESGAAVDANNGGTVIITDGTLTGGTGIDAVTSETSGSVTISGGTFSSDIPEEYLSLSEDEELVEDGKGNYVVGYAVKGVTLTETLALEVGGSDTLTATFDPTTATNQTVTWTSSDDDVATIDANGKVTAVAAGTATITVTTKDGGYTDTCTVTVTEPVKATKFDGTEADILSGNVVAQSKVVVADDGKATKTYRFVKMVTVADIEANKWTTATFSITYNGETVEKPVTYCYSSVTANGDGTAVSKDGCVFVAYSVSGVPMNDTLSATVALS